MWGIEVQPKNTPLHPFFCANAISTVYDKRYFCENKKKPFSFRKEKKFVIALRKSENFLNNKLIMQKI